MTHAETSSPDMRLVELECRNGHVGTPILYRSSAGPIGAHCSACRIWIKWVPQTEVWKSLLAYQEAMRDKPRSATPRSLNWVTRRKSISFRLLRPSHSSVTTRP
jgi:hypothetical protein